ncbi:hypothetical protein NDU88_002400 [Pleurodeles waltl]|uniref:Uncharacterized protein n=1 Tax=Pleurodeles waltl TaxID=8319 RepID=A0AAV7PBJ2_PLEWA|nr:hypothetical protein NDU88_002400 [Pleurodeles waltl]
MVRRDPKQRKLPFEKTTSDATATASLSEGCATGGPTEPQMAGADDIIAKLRADFHAVDAQNGTTREPQLRTGRYTSSFGALQRGSHREVPMMSGVRTGKAVRKQEMRRGQERQRRQAPE